MQRREWYRTVFGNEINFYQIANEFLGTFTNPAFKESSLRLLTCNHLLKQIKEDYILESLLSIIGQKCLTRREPITPIYLAHILA